MGAVFEGEVEGEGVKFSREDVGGLTDLRLPVKATAIFSFLGGFLSGCCHASDTGGPGI